MNDDELLHRLRVALNSDAEPEPSPHSLLFLRGTVQSAIPSAQRQGSRPWLRWLAVLGTALATVGGGSGVALAATDTPLPAALRAAARAVGLPVDSAALAATRDAQQDLKGALLHHDPSAAHAAAAVLQQDFNRLGSSERTKVTAAVAHDLQQAHTDARENERSPSPTPTTAPEDRATPAGGSAGSSPGSDHGQAGSNPNPDTTATTSPKEDATTSPSATTTTQPDEHSQSGGGDGSGSGSGSGDGGSQPRRGASGGSSRGGD